MQPKLGAGGSCHSANAPQLTARTGVEEEQVMPQVAQVTLEKVAQAVPAAGGLPTGGGREPSAGVEQCESGCPSAAAGHPESQPVAMLPQ